MNVFNEIDKFFSSLKNYVEMNEIFFIFVGLFLLTVVVVIISTSRTYEARLIKAIDSFNSYFIDNPQITEDNLVPFNNKMKSNKVPKQLRKQWQQFVLYREKKASEYMSFESCVTIPTKNSTYKRDIGIMNAVSWILAIVCFVINLYMVLSDEVSVILRQAFLTPAIIILLNIIVRTFLDLRHNAVVSDLHQNYQYFEVNIDKATETLPEYVDYEVLFDKNEIKRGIPMLYAYLQKRAEMEKKELERARLKNVHHEKFNFDEAGVESSLVLERAMQEAENYIAERKKLMGDIEQINGDITQEEMNFREVTKEYQRQMQVSKETFDNFKSQLDDASSTIEINYLKKQQQQELDRQRNLERDYDTATDRHKKVLASYQEELTSVENEIKKARNSLERVMLSEFDTYSSKVYDEAMRVVEERERNKVNKLKANIKQLEEQILAKDTEIESAYNQNQNLNSQLANQVNEYKQQIDEQNRILTRVSDAVTKKKSAEQPATPPETPAGDINFANQAYAEEYDDYDNDEFQDFDYTDDESNYATEDSNNIVPQDNAESEPETFDYTDEPDTVDESQAEDLGNQSVEDEDEGEEITPDFDEEEELETFDNAEEGEDFDSADLDEDFTMPEDESKPRKKAGRPRKIVLEEKPKKSVGRPRKVVAEPVTTEPKRKAGRPRKEEPTIVVPKKKAGRPRKEETAPIEPVRKAGRPRKVEEPIATEPKRKAGRPRKEDTIVSREPEVKRPGRPRKEDTAVVAEPQKKRGRPRKGVEDNDIDAFLKEIDDEIAKESAKIAESKKALEQNSKISKRK